MMKSIKLLLFLFTTGLLITSCASGPSKKILAKWTMFKVYNSDEDVSEEHNPNQDRWIEFAEDGSYKSDGTPYGPNSGKWSFTDEGLLYLDSDADEGDDSYWKVEFTDEGMSWQGAKFEFTKTFRITYKKSNTPT